VHLYSDYNKRSSLIGHHRFLIQQLIQLCLMRMNNGHL